MVIVQSQRALVVKLMERIIMSSGYNESSLSAGVRHVHRALASLQEELEAIDYYHQRADQSDDEPLKAILLHNRNEEMEHAAMLMEWLRRNMPEFDGAMKTYLFTSKPVTEIEAAAGSGNESAADLGVGPLK
jgi:ferritin-like protein